MTTAEMEAERAAAFDTTPAEPDAAPATGRKRGPNKPKPTTLAELLAAWPAAAIKAARKVADGDDSLLLAMCADSHARLEIALHATTPLRKPTVAEIRGAITAAEEDGQTAIVGILRADYLPAALERELEAERNRNDRAAADAEPEA